MLNRKSGSLLLGFLAFFLCEPAFSQSSIIRGRVLSENGNLMAGITILLLKSSDSTWLKTAITNKSGVFEVESSHHNILIAASFLNQKTYSASFQLDLQATVFTLPDLVLKTSTNNLKEVTVRGKTPFVEIRTGKTILNVGQSAIASGSNALEVLNRAPGIQIGPKETISMKGKTGILIMIDGKTSNLSSADLMDMLRNMSSDGIDQIELITSPSSKYEAEGIGGLINIKLKKGKNVGTNGSYTGGFGYGKYYKASSGINLNHRTNKLNVFGSYNFNNNKSPESVALRRHLLWQNNQTNFKVSNTDDKLRNSQNYRAGVDYFITPNHTIGALFSGFYNRLTSVEKNSTLIFNNSVLDSTILMFSNERRTTTNRAVNLNYKGTLGKQGGELTLDANHFEYQRRSNEQLRNEFFDKTNTFYRNPLQFQNISPSEIIVKSGKVDYLQPVSKTTTIESGFKFSNAESKNQRAFNTLNNNVWTRDATHSDAFNFSESITAVYFNFKHTLSEKTELEMGLRAEQTNAKSHSVTLNQQVNRKYTNWLPAFRLSHKKNDRQEFTLNFNKRINQPYYEDLNPFIYFLDQYNFIEGNPYLRPEYSHSLEFGHVYKEKISTTLNYTYIKDIFLTYQRQDEVTGVAISSKKNLNAQHSFGFEFSSPLEFTPWWSSTSTLTANYMRFTYRDEENSLNSQSPYMTFNTNHALDISNTLKAEATFKYESETNYGLFFFKPVYVFDLGISQSLMQNKANLRLSVTDIFNNSANRYSTSYQNLDIQVVSKPESRVARLTFSYRFGKSTVKAARRRSTGSEDESKRVRN